MLALAGGERIEIYVKRFHAIPDREGQSNRHTDGRTDTL